MSLSLYKKKRKFDITPEPQGKVKLTKGSLRFVIQKHDATNLHYDFRLEMGGVLKSWAVPKGPSLNPSDKRLAMMVEDHPFDYRTFEGVIPEGNYGGGTVIVWDEGTYEPLEGEGLSAKEQEKLLRKQLYAGNLKLMMHGKKIKGAYALFQMKGRGENAWILVKKEDKYASEQNVLLKNKSVQSGKTLEKVARENGAVIKHPEETVAAKRKVNSGGKIKAVKKAGSPSKKASSKKKLPDIRSLLAGSFPLAKRAGLPVEFYPMLATLTNEAFDDPAWIYEIKWDGYRAVALCEKEVRLVSRNMIDFTDRYAPIATALRDLGIHAVLDGEIVAINDKGLADFQALQNWQNTPAHLQYYIFDCIWLQGYDLSLLPLLERKRILRKIVPENHPVIRFSDHVEATGTEFFKAALGQGLEGIMAKKSDSIYIPGDRSSEWLKIKVNQRQEVVIAGFTRPRNSRKFFGSLLLGVYEGKELKYVGHTGSGFNVKSLEVIHKKLSPLIIDKCPFKKCPKGNTEVTWVKPELVCEIKFTEWTKDGIARHPIFMGLRNDKKPKDVVFEKSMNMAALKTKQPAKNVRKKKAEEKASPDDKQNKGRSKTLSKSVSKDLVSISEGEEQVISLNKQELKLTNLSKLYWKKEKFRKGDMINYYHRIAPYMLPYMLDRPQSLNRHPNGIDGPNFYQKDQKGKVPEWIKTHADFSESTGKTVEYLVCTNEASLIYMANLGCIEMHPWHARSKTWQNPDWSLIDLDPDKGNSFDQVIGVAKLVKEVLDSIGAKAYCKTSGSTGIHIYIPLEAKYSYDQSKQLAELVATLVNHEMPEITSMERSPSKRKGKIYLDYLQNRETQTAAAPYSLRPKPGVPVSTPLDWSELKKGLTPRTWHAGNIFERLKTEGDLFKPVLGKGIDLEKVLSRLASQMK